MIDINTALQNILKAIYGKDVRQSIHDAIYQINQNANEAVDLAQIKFGTAIVDPTTPVGSYIEGTVYFNIATGIIWRLSGGSWAEQGRIKSIDSIDRTASSGLVDTYTITYNDGSTKEYFVTNGASISRIIQASTVGNIDSYNIELDNGKSIKGFDVRNGLDGLSIIDVALASTVGNVKNYDFIRSDGSKTPTGISIADGVSSYVYIRYSASFDGTGMVTVPTDTTVYIGICVTTQATAPTDPSVYSWVRFIGKSGTGSGDMLASDYATQYKNVVDRAVALFDGTDEISATQLMKKADFESTVPGVVNQAAELVDIKNSKVANTEVLAKLSETDDGKLQYNGKDIEQAIDNNTIVKNDDGELEVNENLASVIDDCEEWINSGTKGKFYFHDGKIWECLADNTVAPADGQTNYWKRINLKVITGDISALNTKLGVKSENWTPRLYWGNQTIAPTYTVGLATYSKVGNLATVYIQLNISNLGTGTLLCIDNLPFNVPINTRFMSMGWNTNKFLRVIFDRANGNNRIFLGTDTTDTSSANMNTGLLTISGTFITND